MGSYEQLMKGLLAKAERSDARASAQTEKLAKGQAIGNILATGMRSPTMSQIATGTQPRDIGSQIKSSFTQPTATRLGGSTDEYKRTLDKFKMIGALGEQTKSPSTVKEYEYYTAQETGAGREPMPYNEWVKDLKRAGATNFNLGDKKELEKTKSEERRKADRIKAAEAAWAKAGLVEKGRMKMMGEDPESVRKKIETPVNTPVAAPKPVAKPEYKIGQETKKNGNTYTYIGDDQWQLKR